MIADLEPYPAMRDSGVPWLGEVPEHWEVRGNGRIFAQRNEPGYPDLPILEVSLRTGVRVRDFDGSNRKQVMANRDQYKRAAADDIAYNMMRMWQGAVGVAPLDGLVSPAYVVARPLLGTVPRYFAYLYRTAAYTTTSAISRGPTPTASTRSSRGHPRSRGGRHRLPEREEELGQAERPHRARQGHSPA
jgi:type I restriction enzyme S subunit